MNMEHLRYVIAGLAIGFFLGAAVVGSIAHNVMRKILPRAKDMKRDDEAKMAALARVIRERDAAVNSRAWLTDNQKIMLSKNDPDETMKRIFAVLSRTTFPNNMNVAECVEVMYGQWQNRMSECAKLRNVIQEIEEPWRKKA